MQRKKSTVHRQVHVREVPLVCWEDTSEGPGSSTKKKRSPMERDICEKLYLAHKVSARRSFLGSFRRGEPSARCQESLKVCELAGRLLVTLLSLLASSMIVPP